MQTTIIIRSYNEEKHIGRLLEGLLRQKFDGSYDIVLVDSGSDDATLSIAAGYPIRLVHIPKPLFSFGYALNQGIATTEAAFCVFISAHCYPAHDNWLTELLAPFADEKVALVYGRQFGDQRTRYSEKQIFSKWFPPEADLRQQHCFCNNANAAIRRRLWQEVPYNEALTGLEDLAWAQQMLERGYYLAYNPAAAIFHIHEESYRRVFNRYKREAIAMHRIVRDNRFTWWDAVRLSVWNILVDYVHALRDGQLYGALRDIAAFRLAQFFGTWRGHRCRHSLTQELRNRFYYPARYVPKAELPAGDATPPLTCKSESWRSI